MNLVLEIEGTGQGFEVEFITELTLPTVDLYLLLYEFNCSHYLINDGIIPDNRIGGYSKFFLTKLHHLLIGHFYYNGNKIQAQVGLFVKREFTHFNSMDRVLICANVSTPSLINYSYNLDSLSKAMIIDIEDFNKTRVLLGLPEYSLIEYLERKLSNDKMDKNQFSLHYETSLFSSDPEKFDPSKIMTIKGMAEFVNDRKKDKNTNI